MEQLPESVPIADIVVGAVLLVLGIVLIARRPKAA